MMRKGEIGDQIEGEGVGRSGEGVGRSGGGLILREGVAWDLMISLLILAAAVERRVYAERGVVARWVGDQANGQEMEDGNEVKSLVVFVVLRANDVEANLERVYGCRGDQLKLLVGDEELYLDRQKHEEGGRREGGGGGGGR